MHPILNMVMTLSIGTIILMAGILINRDSGQSIGSVVKESLTWGTGFFFALGTQIAALAIMG